MRTSCSIIWDQAVAEMMAIPCKYPRIKPENTIIGTAPNAIYSVIFVPLLCNSVSAKYGINNIRIGVNKIMDKIDHLNAVFMTE